MPLQHYIPAAYLGNFSHETDGLRRNRLLFVGDKKNHSVFTAPARSIMAENDFYGVPQTQITENSIDQLMSSHEPRLLHTIDLLLDENITCEQWLVLVRFVVSILVRGPDFNRRFENREIIRMMADELPSSNTNMARLMEYQRLTAPIMGASWKVLKTSPADELITNDVGYLPSFDPYEGKPGIAIPLNLHNILLIVPSLKRTVAVGHNGKWLPTIEYHTIDSRPVDEFNKHCYARAIRFIAGSEKPIIQNLINLDYSSLDAIEPAMLGFFSGHMAMAFEHMDINFINIISKPPQNEGDFLYVDFEKNYLNYLHDEEEARKAQSGS